MSDINLEELLQRFAVSGLSRERKSEAVNEEILIGKHTGEFFIKTKEGVVISTDILNRLKASTDNAVRIAELSGITGELYRVDFENLILPNHVDYSVNIIEGEPIELPIDSKKVLLKKSKNFLAAANEVYNRAVKGEIDANPFDVDVAENMRRLWKEHNEKEPDDPSCIFAVLEVLKEWSNEAFEQALVERVKGIAV